MVEAEEFAEIVERIDDELLCCYTDCGNSAHYRADFHRCIQHEWCGFHAGAFSQLLHSSFVYSGERKCSKCKQVFDSLNSFLTLIRI